jgi:hypothetical protein
MRVHACCRFVEENQFGPPNDRASQVDCLLLAAGETPVRGSCTVGEPEPLYQRRHGQWIGVQTGEIAQELDCPDPGPGTSALRHQPDTAGQLPRAGWKTQDPHCSLGWPNEVGATADQRGLARAVRTENRSQCAGLRLQREPVENGAATESDDHIGYPHSTVGTGHR